MTVIDTALGGPVWAYTLDTIIFDIFRGTIEEDPCITGINKINGNKNNLIIYPNPNSGIFTISNSQHSIHNSQLIIQDVLGRTVYNQPIINPYQTTIDISNISNGIYFYRLVKDNEIINGKLIKE